MICPCLFCSSKEEEDEDDDMETFFGKGANPTAFQRLAKGVFYLHEFLGAH